MFKGAKISHIDRVGQATRRRQGKKIRKRSPRETANTLVNNEQSSESLNQMANWPQGS